MPILHLQLSGAAQNQAGQQIKIPSPVALKMVGPCVQVSINVSKSLSQQLIQSGGVVPPAVQGIALIDTGAAMTCIDEDEAVKLTLPVIDVVQMNSASHSQTPANVYPAHFELVGTPIHFDLPRVIGANLKSQKLVALIGRDILARCTLYYNGGAGEFTLSI